MSDDRRRQILDIARRTGKLGVDELVERFDVTPQTIRKDLNRLCEERLLTRTHGGARLASRVENMSHEARRMLARDAKRDIARAVAALVPNDASLSINVGTTNESIAQALLQHSGLLVVTNNLDVAALMRPYAQNKVLIAPGEVRSSDGAVIGEAAVGFVGQFRVDYAIIGASAIDRDGALFDYDYREVSVAREIVANARHVILAADASKHERVAPVRIGHLEEVHTFVTDRCPDAAFARTLAGFEVRLIETARRVPSPPAR